MTITFLQSDWSTQPDPQVIVTGCPVTNIFQNGALRIAGKFVYDSMQQVTKKTKFMKSTSLRTFKVKFLTCNVFNFVFYKNLLCRLRSSYLQHDANNGVNCKKQKYSSGNLY